jgi:predicted DCC family thiol-disulfide oxidoreductase YuxK
MVKVREDRSVRARACYLAIGVTLERHGARTSPASESASCNASSHSQQPSPSTTNSAARAAHSPTTAPRRPRNQSSKFQLGVVLTVSVACRQAVSSPCRLTLRYADDSSQSVMTTTPGPLDSRRASGSHERWTLLYDADCGFCKWIVSGVLAWDRHNRLVPSALQSSEAQALLSDLSLEERLASVHLISPDGERLSGGSVLAPLLRLLPAGIIPALGIARLPHLTSRAYDWVANHRSQLSRAVPVTMKRRASARVNRAEVKRAESP